VTGRIRFFSALRLLLRFMFHCLSAGISTARLILVPGQMPSGFVLMEFKPMSRKGAAVLGAMVTLSPGSSVIDIDMEQRELLIHLLDLRHAESGIAGIRRDFEPDIQVLFPEES